MTDERCFASERSFAIAHRAENTRRIAFLFVSERERIISDYERRSLFWDERISLRLYECKNDLRIY